MAGAASARFPAPCAPWQGTHASKRAFPLATPGVGVRPQAATVLNSTPAAKPSVHSRAMFLTLMRPRSRHEAGWCDDMRFSRRRIARTTGPSPTTLVEYGDGKTYNLRNVQPKKKAPRVHRDGNTGPIPGVTPSG